MQKRLKTLLTGSDVEIPEHEKQENKEQDALIQVSAVVFYNLFLFHSGYVRVLEKLITDCYDFYKELGLEKVRIVVNQEG